LTAGQLFGQSIYMDPTPTDVFMPARLYIDITSSDCGCPELQDADPVSNPLYIWTWMPEEFRPPLGTEDVGNGDWGNSNENMRMKQDETNPNLWYYDFLGAPPVQFYDVPAAELYGGGISFLVKEKNGAPEGEPEQKSEDLSYTPESPGCLDKVCYFPTIWYPDDYLIITYDNGQEQNNGLQNLGPDECYVWFGYSVDGGPLQTLQGSDDKFKMNYIGANKFDLTMIPREYFELNEGETITELRVLFTKPPVNVPPFTTPDISIPGCQ